MTGRTYVKYPRIQFLILSPFLIELCKFGNYSVDWVLGRTNNKFLDKKNEDC